LSTQDLKGKKFLDIGSGSGLMSLAARRLGADIYSFDYDPQSVACTTELKQRYYPNDDKWHVEEGSVLDTEYLARLGQFDIVYSWGVLHHTGEMWQALENISPLVAHRGKLFIAIYNNQGGASKRWLSVKKLYNKLPSTFRFLILIPAYLHLRLRPMIISIIRGKFSNPWKNYAKTSTRGMSSWYDFIDWVGGFPFEVAKPEEIFQFYYQQGFELQKLKTCAGGLGCNEFIFIKKHVQ